MRNRRVYLVTWCVTLFCLPAALYCVWLLVRMFLYDQFVIPSNSMRPTLIPGDRVVVNKLIMGPRIYTDFDFREGGQELKSVRMRGLRRLKHNDIVVFNYPLVNDSISFKINYVYCKRCIALPGDSLSIENGHYQCNNYDGVLGLQSEQERLETVPDDAYDGNGMAVYPFDERVGWTFKHMGPMYIPRDGDIIQLTAKDGIIYNSLLEYETGKTVTIDWDRNCVFVDGVQIEKHIWRHNYYFMAGDNVHDSMDSRYWGLVPEEYIVGVVKFISYARDKDKDIIKWDRFLKQL